MTPGIPKNPAINAVIGFIAIVKPIVPPIRLVIYNNTNPIIPFIINFFKTLNGNDKILNITINNIIPATPYKISNSRVHLLYFFSSF